MKVAKFGFTVFLIFTFFCCSLQKSEWQGTIEEVDGVTVVKNPNEPLYGELVFDLEEDLNIGNEKDDNYVFYGISDIQIDKDGNFYVLESGNVRVQKFDKNGNYICTIGRQGQGPGEYQRPSQVIINEKEGTVGVKEMRKLIVFDKNGKFLDRDIAFEEYFFEGAAGRKDESTGNRSGYRHRVPKCRSHGGHIFYHSVRLYGGTSHRRYRLPENIISICRRFRHTTV